MWVFRTLLREQIPAKLYKGYMTVVVKASDPAPRVRRGSSNRVRFPARSTGPSRSTINRLKRHEKAGPESG
jgi:hypothetical protein